MTTSPLSLAMMRAQAAQARAHGYRFAEPRFDAGAASESRRAEGAAVSPAVASSTVFVVPEAKP